VKDWWMKNREVLDTDACGELVVNNSVEDGSNDASDRYFKSFHRIVGLDQILTVVTSPLHSEPPIGQLVGVVGANAWLQHAATLNRQFGITASLCKQTHTTLGPDRS
jgi:hypothetical protein